MSKNNTTTSDDVKASISSIYSDLLKKRTIEYEHKQELKRLKEEEKKQQKEEKKEEKNKNLTKEERRKAEIDRWKEVIIGLTGDDLDYSSDKKNKKKKYKKWIDDDSDQNVIKPVKNKKQKKKNYNKEFEPELNMLKALVAEQNRFSSELLKRYQNAAGPNNKDSMPPNKTLVELIATINASRSNSLGMLREIGNIKKTIADLYMKQKKLDADLQGNGSISDTDLALMGSNIASSIFGDTPSISPQPSQVQQNSPVNQQEQQSQNIFPDIVSSFDPDSWEGPEFDANTKSVMYENIPHHVVVEWHKDQNKARFKAVRDDNGMELTGAPIPSIDPSKLSFNEKDMRVKGQFDEVYKLEIIN